MDNMLALRVGSRIKFISYNEIIYCKAEGRYTHIVLKNGKSIMTAKLLKSFENKLPADIFLRIHKSYIINLNYISNYNKNNNAILLLGTSTKLVVSKRRKRRILEVIDSKFTLL
jgi:two-component system, LytTR family, response regulator